MERDCLIGYGASMLLLERLMISSDEFTVPHHIHLLFVFFISLTSQFKMFASLPPSAMRISQGHYSSRSCQPRHPARRRMSANTVA